MPIENLLDQLSDVNWIQVLAGSLIPVLLYLINGLRSSFRTRKLRKNILGHWYSYHYTRVNHNVVFRKEEWDISTHFFSKKIKIRIIDLEKKRKELKYTGTVEFDDNYVLINADGDGHSEIIQIRLTKPIPNEDTVVLGFYLGKDFSHEIFTTPTLVCQKQKDDESVKSILKESSTWHENDLSLRLEKKPFKVSGSVQSE